MEQVTKAWKVATYLDKEHKDIEQSFQWMKHSGPKGVADSLYLYCKHVINQGVTDKWRLCHSQPETMKLTISECQQLAAEKYLNEPNQVAAELNLDFCKYYNIKMDAQLWYDNNPDKVIANDKVKVLWDSQISTDRHISCSKPDIGFKEDIDECLVIDVAIAQWLE